MSSTSAGAAAVGASPDVDAAASIPSLRSAAASPAISVPPTAPAGAPAKTASRRLPLFAAGAVVLALGGGAFVLSRRHGDAPAARHAPAGTTAPATAPASPLGSGAGAAQKSGTISIAVLPFADTSPKKDQEWLSDGFSEELLVHLAKIKELRVVGRSSAFSFKNSTDDDATIAKKLGVTNLVEGSVAKAHERIRTTAPLLNAADRTQLWGESFDRNGTDVFAMQAQIASAVANALEVKLVTPPAPIARTTNPAAHEQLLRGRLYYRRDGKEELEQAAAAFQAAIDLDPGYAEAYAGLGYTLSYLADHAATPQERQARIDRAHTLAHKAVELGPDLAATHRVLALLQFSFDWEWDAAKASLARALELEPRDADTLRQGSRLAAALGDETQAASLAARAVEVEPLVAPSWNEVGIRHAAVGQLVEARKAINHALELNPKSTFAKNRLGMIDLLEGKPDDAFARAETIATPGFKLMVIAMSEHSRGHAKESQAALDKLIETEGHTFAYQIVEVFAWRGDVDKAFEWLDKALELRDGGLQEVRSDPMLSKLHADPRFNAFLAKMKLPPLRP